MQTHWTIQDAKNQFSKVVDVALRGTPQTVTRRGVPVVTVLAHDQYTAMAKRDRTDNGFAQFLLSMPTRADEHGTGDPAGGG